MNRINWDENFLKHNDYSTITTKLLDKIIAESGVSSGSALDLGCGTGQLSCELYHRGFQVLGIDVSLVALKLAKNASPYINYYQANLENPLPAPVTDKTYDLITCNFVFAFVDDKELMLRNVKKLFNKQSALVIMNATKEQTPEKPGIRVDLDQTLAQLKQLFGQVKYYQSSNSTTFIAKNL